MMVRVLSLSLRSMSGTLWLLLVIPRLLSIGMVIRLKLLDLSFNSLVL